MKFRLRHSINWSTVCLFCCNTSSDSYFFKRNPLSLSWSWRYFLLLLCYLLYRLDRLTSVLLREEWWEIYEGILLATSWIIFPSSIL
jgi:hypothetical protein